MSRITNHAPDVAHVSEEECRQVDEFHTEILHILIGDLIHDGKLYWEGLANQILDTPCGLEAFLKIINEEVCMGHWRSSPKYRSVHDERRRDGLILDQVWGA